MIFLYRTITFFLYPVLSLAIYLRRFTNKEDKIRFKEKISININENYFPKNKKIYWIHAASIGETNSIVPLIRKLIQSNKNIFILLTSTTLSSSELIKKLSFDKDNFQHRFFPLDLQFLVKNFLNYWKPELIIFIDSEVWPNFLLEISKRKIPLVLLNGRITMKTFRRWKIVPNLSKKIFGLYNLCLSSSKESEINLKLLGAKNVKFIGNLKFCPAVEKKINDKNFELLSEKFNIWCAASTHPGEEEIILKTHSLLRQKNNNVITIIIPRHITRSNEIQKVCDNYRFKCRIVNKLSEINDECEIFIINSIGEMTNYFYNCKSIFMGKSFLKKLIKVGGQNPIEPAKCGCKIYHGPYVSNFKEVYNLLNKKNITNEVSDENELYNNLLKDFKNSGNLNDKNIEDLNNYGEQILTSTVNEVLRIKNEI